MEPVLASGPRLRIKSIANLTRSPQPQQFRNSRQRRFRSQWAHSEEWSFRTVIGKTSCEIGCARLLRYLHLLKQSAEIRTSRALGPA